MNTEGFDSESKINPLVPVDLVIDHSVQVDVSRSENVLQVNLEYLARVVFNSNGLLYPNTVLETDSHSSMVNGLGVAGWGVGGIEAEPSMLDQNLSRYLESSVLVTPTFG
ncbi:hypothetical protein L2E82_44078 [Cichorium intybus]|uniref:Uncharacterized protein n=1 Tax=Cichorium intybus TaxID=13427 RepID=A0ACB8ZQR1_CICIN|nr:hypothetical protein L2E82_44078 [Cichorium intybus]